MISDKVILIFGFIIADFVLSANCGDSSEEKTEIKTIVEEMQDFLTRLKELDEGLHIPESFEKLGKIKKRIWSPGWHFARHIKNKESHFEYFKDAYEKFVDYSVECITQYLQQFDKLGRFIGTQYTRANFLTRYNTEFVKKMKLRGHQSTETEAMYKKLEEKLTDLCNRIYSMVYVPPQPVPIVIVAPSDHHHHSSSSSSHSHSHEKRHDVEAEHGYYDTSNPDHAHGNGELVAAAVGGAAVGALGAVAVEEMVHDSESEQAPPDPAPVEEAIPPAPVEEEVELSHVSHYPYHSNAAVDEYPQQTGYAYPQETGYAGAYEENGNVNVSDY